MESEWVNTTLGDLCVEQGGRIQTGPFGSQLHASDYQEVGTPVVMPLNLVDGNVSEDGIARVNDDHVSKLAKHQLRPDDIVFSRRGDVTRFALITERESGWLCGTGCLKISLGTERLANPQFIAGVLSLPETKDWLIQHAVGATMPNLNTGILSAIPMSLPGLAHQSEVAGFLEAIKSRIDLLRQTNTTLEAIAQALFKSWLVDFDPVHAKAEGREPEAMDAATAALFPSEFEESELGLIPKGWRATTFGELLKDSIGGDWGKDQADETHNCEVAIVRGTDIPDLRTCSPSRVPQRFTTTKKLESRKLAEGDLVVEVSGGSKDQPTGRSLFITKELLGRFDCPV
ncbi:MAG: restriction endonuclease subunit S, partial [Rhodanobacter sp.]